MSLINANNLNPEDRTENEKNRSVHRAEFQYWEIKISIIRRLIPSPLAPPSSQAVAHHPSVLRKGVINTLGISLELKIVFEDASLSTSRCTSDKKILLRPSLPTGNYLTCIDRKDRFSSRREDRNLCLGFSFSFLSSAYAKYSLWRKSLRRIQLISPSPSNAPDVEVYWLSRTFRGDRGQIAHFFAIWKL